MPLEIFSAIILAILQGITEWLPISSSAHLAMAQILLGIQVPVYFDVMLHVGTVIAAVVFMRNELFSIIKS
ncbi:MAG: undecaprenyl-diphosphate phosphatase, partial [Candidatus Micrarchaeota archaeon]